MLRIHRLFFHKYIGRVGKLFDSVGGIGDGDGVARVEVREEALF